MNFEVNEKYKAAKLEIMESADLSVPPEGATCHHVDENGNAWSRDVLWRGELPREDNVKGWCFATRADLETGSVVKIQEDTSTFGPDLISALQKVKALHFDTALFVRSIEQDLKQNPEKLSAAINAIQTLVDVATPLFLSAAEKGIRRSDGESV